MYSEKWPTFCKRLLPHWSRGSFHCCFVVRLVRNEEWLAKQGWHWVLFGILLHLFCWNVLSQKGAKKRWTYVLIWDRHRCSHKVHITEEIKLHHTWLHTNRWQCQHFFSRQTRKLADMLQVSTKANMSQKYQIQQNIWNVLFAVWKKYSSKHDHSKLSKRSEKVSCCFFGVLCWAEMAWKMVQTSSAVITALCNSLKGADTICNKCSEILHWLFASGVGAQISTVVVSV